MLKLAWIHPSSKDSGFLQEELYKFEIGEFMESDEDITNDYAEILDIGKVNKEELNRLIKSASNFVIH